MSKAEISLNTFYHILSCNTFKGKISPFESEKINLIYSILASTTQEEKIATLCQGLQKSSEQMRRSIWRQNISINEFCCKTSSKIDIVIDNFIVKIA